MPDSRDKLEQFLEDMSSDNDEEEGGGSEIMLWQTSILRCSLGDRTWNWDETGDDDEDENFLEDLR